MIETAALARAIDELIEGLPAALTYRLAELLAEEPGADWSRRRANLLNASPQPAVARRVTRFMDQWRELAPEIPPSAVSLAMRASVAAVERMRRSQRVELVWTGPDSGIIPLRRTDQALLQLIQEARESLHIVSFAVYKIEAIVQALLNATERGVRVAIYLETPSSSEGKVTFDPLGTLGGELAQRAAVYVWPLAQRPLSADGRHGSLHAKLALADGTRLLISSANLTEYAMSLNIEAGVLITGGSVPLKVERHLRQLVEIKAFERI